MERNILKDLLIENKNIIDNEFFDKLKENSLLEFRKNIQTIQEISPTFFIYNKVLDYYDKLLQEFNSNSSLFNIYDIILKYLERREFDFLYDYNNYNYLLDKKMLIQLQDYCCYSERVELSYQYLKNATNYKISEIVVDGLFQDTIYNVWINIRELLRFHDLLSNDEKVFDNEKLQFYKTILEIDKIDCENKINLYQKLKNKNINLMFYEDLRILKDISYKKIQDNLFKPNNKLLNEKDSNKYNVSIYDLDGIDFFMLIRCGKKINDVSKVRRYCYTLISSYNMDVFNKDKFIYGYEEFFLSHILHVFENDSYSSTSNTNLSYICNKYVNRIMFPEQIASSVGYSEIQIINKKKQVEDLYEVLKPSYLVVFDNIEDRHIEEAKRLGISIVKISMEKYFDRLNLCSSKKINLNFNEYEEILDDYTNGSYMEYVRKLKRRIR